MTSPVRVERKSSESLAPPPVPPHGRISITAEMPAVSASLIAALRDDKVIARRDVLRWQRRFRLGAIIGASVLSLVLAGSATAFSVAWVGLVYTTVVLIAGWTLGRSSSEGALHATANALTVADVAAASMLCFVTAPSALYRVLIFGLLVTQLAAFYFGRITGAIGALASGIGYAVPAIVVGTPLGQIGVNVSLFLIASLVLIAIAAGLNARMDAVRTFCGVAEQGGIATVLPALPDARRPDQFSLVTRGMEAMHASLSEQMGSDPLTGCLNRRAFEARLRTELRHARRRNSSVAVAAIDLDHFKTINDTQGHHVGDVVLQQLSSIMHEIARETDAVARYGGDEFVIALPDTDWQGALSFADRLRRRVDETVFGPPDAIMRLTISVGVALARGSDPVSTETILKDADSALYRAKSAGRNRVFS